MSTDNVNVYVQFVPNTPFEDRFVAAHYVARMGDRQLVIDRDYGNPLAPDRARVARLLAERWLGGVVPVGAVQKVDDYTTRHTFRKKEKSNEEG